MSESFLVASRRKLRFVAPNGSQLDIEDLWDLSLKALDAIAVSVDAALAPRSKSFLENPDRKADLEQADNELRLEILKTVITVKQIENKVAREAAAKAKSLDFLKSLREKKQIEALEGLSAEEIEAQIAAIENPVPAPAE
jgi:hypothetical protein